MRPEFYPLPFATLTLFRVRDSSGRLRIASRFEMPRNAVPSFNHSHLMQKEKGDRAVFFIKNRCHSFRATDYKRIARPRAPSNGGTPGHAQIHKNQEI